MSWFQRLFTRRSIYNDLAEEMREHLEEKVEELVARGVLREEARHQAQREFGNATLLEERGREQWQWPTLEGFWADVKFGLRQLQRYRGFTITAVLTLALGIGANTAIFTLIDSIMLRPLPFPQQERLVSISSGMVFSQGLDTRAAEHSQSFTSFSDMVLTLNRT